MTFLKQKHPHIYHRKTTPICSPVSTIVYPTISEKIKSQSSKKDKHLEIPILVLPAPYIPFDSTSKTAKLEECLNMENAITSTSDSVNNAIGATPMKTLSVSPIEPKFVETKFTETALAEATLALLANQVAYFVME